MKMEGWVDVVAGKMTLKEATDNIFNTMFVFQPRELVMKVELKTDCQIKGYYVTIWISESDFGKRKK